MRFVLKDEFDEVVDLVSSGIGTAKPGDTPADGINIYNVSTVGTYIHFLKADGTPISVTVDDLKGGLISLRLDGLIWEKVKTTLPLENYIQKEDSPYGYYGPYSNADAACGTILNAINLKTGKNYRDSKLVLIGINGNYELYWWKAGFTDGDLIPFQTELNDFPLSTNLFNKDTAVLGFYPRYDSGVLLSSTASAASDWIAVNPSTNYIKRYNEQIAFYDSNKMFISGLDSTPLGKFSTPGNCSFVRITTSINQVDTQQLNEGNLLLPYKPYISGRATLGVKVENVVGLPEVSELVTIKNIDAKLKLGVISKNLFNKASVSIDRYANWITGEILPVTGFSASDFIVIQPGTFYIKRRTEQLAFYDLNKTFISGLSATNGGFTSPANAYFLRFTVNTSFLDVEQLNQGNVLLPYDTYVFTREDLNIRADKVIGLPAINTLVTESNIDDKIKLKPLSTNLFDKNSVTLNKYVTYLTGEMFTLANSSASDFIAIEPNQEYIKTGTDQLAFYDANKVYISGLVSTIGGKFTSPPGAAFVRLTVPTSKLSSEKVNKGSVSLPYEKFYFGRDNLSVKAENVYGLPDSKTIVTKENFDVSAKFVPSSTNLFDKSTVIKDKYVVFSSGEVVNGVNFSASDFMPILPSTTYIKKRTQQLAFYDANKVYISGIATTPGAFSSPATAAFLRITIETAGLDIEQVNQGSELLPYAPYFVSRSDFGVNAANVIGLNNAIGREIKIQLPSELYLIKGQKFSIYFRNIIKYSKYVELQGYSVRVQKRNADNTYAEVGEGFPYKWDYMPTDTTRFNIEIRVLNDYDGTIIASKVISMSTVDPAAISNKAINVVTIGDSFTDGWGVSTALGDFLNSYSTGVSANLIGCNSTNKPAYKDDAWSGYDHNFFYGVQWGYLRSDRPLSEAKFAAGWGLNEPNGWVAGQTVANLSAAQIAQGQSPNEFYNPATQKFDFSYFMQTRFPTFTRKGSGPNNVNVFISFLGINDAWSKNPVTLQAEVKAGGKYRTILPYIYDSILAFDPTIRIFISTITPQPDPSKFMGSYGGSWLTSERVKFCQEIWNEFILEVFDTPAWKAKGLIVMATAAHFDTRTSLRSQNYYPCKFNTTLAENWDFDIHPLSEVGGKYMGDTGAMAIYNKGL